MNINILCYSLFSVAGQKVDHTFVKFIIYPVTMIWRSSLQTEVILEELVGGTELENCFEYSVHCLCSPF